MNLKTLIYGSILLTLCAGRLSAQGFTDSAAQYMEHVNRSLMMPMPPDGRYCPRVYFNGEKRTITFEYAGSAYNDTRWLNEGHAGSVVDSIPGHIYPREKVIDWGTADNVRLDTKARLKPEQLEVLKKLYGSVDDIVSCRQMDIDRDGKQEWIVIRKAAQATMLMRPMGSSMDRPVFAVDIFSFSGNTYTRRYELAYEQTLSELCLSSPGKGELYVLFLQVYDAASGAFQVGCDRIVW